MQTLEWLQASFAVEVQPANKPSHTCSLAHLLWQVRAFGMPTKEGLLTEVKYAVWTNGVDILQWIWALQILTPAEVSSVARVGPCYMRVATLHAIWDMCGDDLYVPVFAQQRDQFVSQLCAKGDGVGLSFAYAAETEPPPARVTNSMCRADRVSVEFQQAICMAWLEQRHGVDPDPPSPPPLTLEDDISAAFA
jgi:hypothetical protein